MKVDKHRRAELRKLRRMIGATQNELATLAGVSQDTIARFERSKHVSMTTEGLIGEALIQAFAKKNPEAVEQAAKPMLETIDKYGKILALEPGTPQAIEIERLAGKSLSELKAEAEILVPFFRGFIGES